MKKYILFLFVIFLSVSSVNSQNRNKLWGYLLPKGYVIVDSLILANQQTKAAILSPYVMTVKGCRTYKNNGQNRILLIKRKSKFYRYDNVISNEVYGYIEGNENLKKSREGFELWFEKGQSCTFEYHIYISFHYSQFKVTEIVLNTICDDQNLRKSIRYRNFLLQNYHRGLIEKLKIKYSM